MSLEHSEGFEKERLFGKALGSAAEQCPDISSGTVEMIIGLVAPKFIDGLFERRPCVRRLRYLGPWWTDLPNVPGSPLQVGDVYESVDFNGATYTIRVSDHETQQTGCAYFERLT